MSTQVVLYDGRLLTVAGLAREGLDMSAKPVAALLPAYSDQDIAMAVDVVEDLVGNGCLELCCAGPKAESLHDRIDALLEGRGWVDVVTTFHTDTDDACEYFLFAANAATGNLLALVETNRLLREALQAEVDS
jgi:hypothetical protein